MPKPKKKTKRKNKKGKKRKQEPVLLLKDPMYWKQLPAEIQASLVESKTKIAEVRKSLLAVCKIDYVPPIRILSTALVSRDLSATIYGRGYAVNRAGDSHLLCDLSATTAVFVEEEDILESIISHEFLHIFELYQEMAAGILAGQKEGGTEKCHALDIEEDKRRLAKKEDWFLPSARIDEFSRNDHRVLQIQQRIKQEWFGRNLPYVKDDGDFTVRSPFFPPEIVRHLEVLFSTTD